MPPNQTPKFVIMKKITAPVSAPKILFNIVSLKYREIKAINITLPHVKKTVLWNPMIKSVIAKLINNAGKYLKPKITGI